MNDKLILETDDGDVTVFFTENARTTSEQADDGLTPKGANKHLKSKQITSLGVADLKKALLPVKEYLSVISTTLKSPDLHPSEITIEVGIKMSGSTGFVIANAGAETHAKIQLTWKQD